jgi:hypothetical protein
MASHRGFFDHRCWLVTLSLLFQLLPFANSTIGIEFPDDAYVWNITAANQQLNITWINNSLDDPSTANLVLVDPVVYPPYDVLIASSVPIADGFYVVRNLTPPSGTYRIEFQEGTNRTVLAESGTFTVADSLNTTSSSATVSSGSTATSSPATSSSPTATSSTGSTPSSTGTSKAVRIGVGIGVGVPLGILLVVGVGFLIWRRRKRPDIKEPAPKRVELKSEMPTEGHEIQKRSKESITLHEIDTAESKAQELGSGERIEAHELDATPAIPPQELP